MNKLLIIFTLAFPRLLSAQVLATYAGAGSYVLANYPTARLTGELTLDTRDLNKLVIKNSEFGKVSMKPAELLSFRIQQRQFVVLPPFKTTTEYLSSKAPAFAEQVDSGRVVLLRYFSHDEILTPSGHWMASTDSQYLLRAAGDSLYSLAANRKQFREALLPLLADRPDLVKLLDARVPNSVVTDNIPGIVHAFNTGQSYAFPLTHYDLMLQQAAARKAQKEAAKTDTTRH